MHRWQVIPVLGFMILMAAWQAPRLAAQGSEFTIRVEDEVTQQPTVARIEIVRADGRVPLIRKALNAGRGIVIAEAFTLELPDGTYQFRLTRGLESRVITGHFELERTSQDDITVKVPRMVEMKREAWISTDFCVPPQTDDLKVRMMAEDLHFAAVMGPLTPPTARALTPQNTAPYAPLWTMDGLLSSEDRDLLFYPGDAHAEPASTDVSETASETLARLSSDGYLSALANPFSWALPVHVASGHLDGVFVMGDWLREDRQVKRIDHGRPTKLSGFDDPTGPGRYAEFIYWNLLEAGCQLPPLAGTGVGFKSGKDAVIGYNRVYVTAKDAAPQSPDDDPSDSEDETTGARIRSAAQCRDAAFAGQSVITNGPMLRPTLGGFRPGHVFKAASGEALELGMELNLSVQDAVEYLEIIQNGRSFHQARLDEFAAAGGKLPIMNIKKSGWVIVRVVTKHEGHYRMAMSAPWYVEFDSQPRISREAVRFFGEWLSDYEQRLKTLPEAKLKPHIPFVVAARQFWRERLERANAN